MYLAVLTGMHNSLKCSYSHQYVYAYFLVGEQSTAAVLIWIQHDDHIQFLNNIREARQHGAQELPSEEWR